MIKSKGKNRGLSLYQRFRTSINIRQEVGRIRINEEGLAVP